MTQSLTLPGLLVFATLLVAPPLLLLLASLRRYRREVYRHGKPARFFWTSVGAGVVLALNGFLTLPTATAMLNGGVRMIWAHWLALAASWVCFWVWVGLDMLIRRSRSRRSTA
jgi:hypothetical protein